jgi:hypothetical protein
MSSRNTDSSGRGRSVGLCALMCAAVAMIMMMAASGEDTPSEGPAMQEYLVLEQDDLIFNTIDLARGFLIRMGAQGWIFPDGTQLLAHTFEPGTAAAYTRILIRPTGPYSEETAFIILRRERR